MFSDSTKEGLECQINPYCDILQDLGMDTFQRGAFVFEYAKGFLLLIEREVFPILLIRRFASFKQVVIEPTALFKRLIELSDLLLIRKDTILKGFTHMCIIAQNRTDVKGREKPNPSRLTRNAAFIPMLENIKK